MTAPDVGGASETQVRTETSGDLGAIARVNDAAFGQSAESRIVDAVRRGGHARISLVAAAGGEIVGHILFTPVMIEGPGRDLPAAGLGPMAVLPAWQRRGIGSMLVSAGLAECARLGYEAVVVVGHPEFYPRFGFRLARAFGLRSEYDVPNEVFMALELAPGALEGRGGLVKYLPEFSA